MTIMEGLIVIAIIGIIIALVSPQVCSVKAKIKISDNQTNDIWKPMDWTPDER